MKRRQNRLESSVLSRLEAGLPLTRWQQARLHVQTACRHGWRLNASKAWFHVRGVLRVLSKRGARERRVPRTG
jgi:hypothetical protein